MPGETRKVKAKKATAARGTPDNGSDSNLDPTPGCNTDEKTTAKKDCNHSPPLATADGKNPQKENIMVNLTHQPEMFVTGNENEEQLTAPPAKKKKD